MPAGYFFACDYERVRVNGGAGTTVRFTHRDLWDEEAVRSHEDGWGKCFDNLERVLAEDLAAG